MSDHAVPESIVERIRRIFALFEQATTENEREVAKNKLDRLLNEYGVTLADLGIGVAEEIREVHSFEFKDPEERSILIHLAGRFNGYVGPNKDKIEYYKVYRSRTRLGIKLTRVQAIDFRIQYDYYCEEWRRYRALMHQAFLDNNDLSRTVENPAPSTFSWSDRQTMERMRKALPSENFKKALPVGKKQLPG